MWWRALIVAAAAILIVSGLLYWRGERSYRPTLAAEAQRSGGITLSHLYAGGPPADAAAAASNTQAELNGFDVSEGKRLYHWFNCVGCHANGGGDIGPALMDDKWIYGAEPRNIRATILEGRPNGMPSYRGKIPDAQVWQIVAYVRSMSGQVPGYAASGRNDDLQSKPSETLTPPAAPAAGGMPPADR